ncbi:MAG: polysaccharide deacetylase [Deltaproteobacteria bacterium SM23_61]|nr:MAG: polysaccharide deacetylase [Deltaproteobacteria bacterium SM23_61]
MKKHLACLTFDFDAMSGFIARGMTSATPVSRGEFGADVGTPRILALLKKHRILSSWYIPGHTLETYPDRCKEVYDGGHEIAHHGWTHVPPALLTRQEEEDGLVRANEEIKKLTGRYARGYRSPAWDLSPHSVELLLKHGFLYDSSMMGNDFTPYRVRKGDLITLDKPALFGQTSKLIEMPVSWTLDDHPHFEFIRTKEWILPGLMNPNLVLEDWINDFNYMKKMMDWGVIIYTFHPYVIGRGGRMTILEKLIRKLKDGGAVFTTMEAAASEYEKRIPFKE